MNKVFLLIGCFLFYTSLIAQEIDYPNHVIHFNDGSIIHGFMTELDEDYIELRVLRGTTMKIARKDINKIEPNRPNDFFFESGLSFTKTGNLSVLSISSAYSNTLPSFNVRYENLQFFRPQWAAGLGTGFDFHAGESFNFSFFPVYAQIRNYPFNRRLSPFYALDVGWSFPAPILNNIENGYFSSGMMIQPALGIRFASPRKATFMLKMGYLVQFTVAEYQDYDWQESVYREVIEDIIFRRLSFSSGFIF